MEIQNYLDFLRYSLSDSSTIPESIVGIKWNKLLVFAKEQAIVGVYARRLLFENEKLNECDWMSNRPSEDDVMEWMGEVTKIRRRNHLLFEKTAEISKKVKRDGFNCCILKGQGNALRYPIPDLRTSGDIDIWIWRRDLKDRDLRELVKKSIRNSFPNTEMVYQHIEYPIYKDVPVEVHFHASYFNNPFKNKKLQMYFNNQKSIVSSNIVSWEKGTKTYAFPAPTDNFNRFFELCHIMHHEFDEGIGLRQLVDYYYLLRRGFTEEERRQDCKLLRSFKMYRFASAVMFIMKEVFGLDDKYLLVKPDNKSGLRLFNDIIRGGNFGKHNKSFKHNHKAINPQRFFFKTFHNLSLVRHFPSETLWEPLFRTWHFLWRHFYNQKK